MESFSLTMTLIQQDSLSHLADICYKNPYNQHNKNCLEALLPLLTARSQKFDNCKLLLFWFLLHRVTLTKALHPMQFQLVHAAFQQGIPKLSSASSSAAGPTDTTAGPSAPSQFAHGAEEHWHQQWGGGNLVVLIHYDSAKSHIALRWMFEQSHIQYLRPRSESAFDA